MNDPTPRGPEQLNPIQGINSVNGYTDFRPRPSRPNTDKHEPTAFEKEMLAKQEAMKDERQELEARAPRTAFEVELLRRDRPLGATESAELSGEEKVESESPAPVEKAKKSEGQQVPQGSSNAPKSGPSAPRASATKT